MGGWGSFLDRITSWLPIQKPVERWKNELESLQKEKEKLLKGEADDKTIKRMEWVINRINTLNGLLKNRATDN